MAILTLTTPAGVHTSALPAHPLGPDGILLVLCAEFRRRQAALGAVPTDADESAHDVAWTARQDVVDQIAGMRPRTDAGRSAKAGVGVTMLLETPRWERNSEWRFALETFRTEARA